MKLLYGSGLRISEELKLRVQDIDFEYKQITVRDDKGKKDRVTPLAQEVVSFLENHLKGVKALHELDLENGLGAVYLPLALAKKYPNADKEFGWQYFFQVNGSRLILNLVLSVANTLINRSLIRRLK